MAGREYLLSTIRNARNNGRIALCGYFLTGYPNPTLFYRLVRVATRLDVLELGIPSTEPRFDGPIISSAHQLVVRERGLDPETALALIGGLRDVAVPKLVMTYARDGRNVRGFLHSCTLSGIQGVLAPDIDRTEGSHVALLAQAMDLAYIPFVDPAMPLDAIDDAALGGDLVYLRIAPGCTGGSATFDLDDCQQTREVLGRMRRVNPDILVAGGIGIRRPDQVATLAALGLDMAIVGTTLVEQLELGEDQLVRKVDELRQATQVYSA